MRAGHPGFSLCQLLTLTRVTHFHRTATSPPCLYPPLNVIRFALSIKFRQRKSCWVLCLCAHLPYHEPCDVTGVFFGAEGWWGCAGAACCEGTWGCWGVSVVCRVSAHPQKMYTHLPENLGQKIDMLESVFIFVSFFFPESWVATKCIPLFKFHVILSSFGRQCSVFRTSYTSSVLISLSAVTAGFSQIPMPCMM